MKKPTLLNCVIIIGLLVLCVMTLLAVYATAPESSVLLLDETFSSLDENKWRHEISSCSEDGTQFHYNKGDKENGFVADGILHIFSNPFGAEPKTKREALAKCASCTACNSSLFSATLETKDVFYATAGKIAVRAKFQKGSGVKLRIGVFSNNSNSENAKTFQDNSEETTSNDSDQLIVTFLSSVDQMSLRSAVPDNDFHIHEVEWNSDKVNFNTDHKKVQGQDRTNGFSNGTAQLTNVPLTQPFYLSVKVDFSEKPAGHSEKHTDSGLPNDTGNHKGNNFAEESILEIDYIKLFRVKN